MSSLLLIAQLGIGALLAWAGAAKLLETNEFRGTLRLSGLPDSLANVLAITVPLLELVLAALLVLAAGSSLIWMFLLSAALFASFAAWTLEVKVRGLNIRCGCFGSHGRQISWETVLRNVALVAFSLTGAALAHYTESVLPGLSTWSLIATTAGLAVIGLVTAFRQNEHALILSMERLRESTQMEG